MTKKAYPTKYQTLEHLKNGLRLKIEPDLIRAELELSTKSVRCRNRTADAELKLAKIKADVVINELEKQLRN